MTRAAIWLLTAGALLFIGVLISQGLPAVFATLAVAGWGLGWVALFHLLPLALDAEAIRVLFDRAPLQTSDAAVDAPETSPEPLGPRATLLARWVGESATSLAPGGQIGGPVIMARHLAQRGLPLGQAAAAITVSTTLQSLAQILFALMGVALLGLHASELLQSSVRNALWIAGAVLVLTVVPFYFVQRRGLYSGAMRAMARFAGQRDWSALVSHAQATDVAVAKLYAQKRRTAACFVLNLIGWLVGTGEVYLILQLLHSPVGWREAFLLESLGQAIRGAGFAIPGSLGVQEGGYLLLAPLAHLSPQTALALSLAKRAREMVLGVPGMLYLHLAERHAARRHCANAG